MIIVGSTSAPISVEGAANLDQRLGADSVLVACPDARPPAYQAVIGLARAGLLRKFHTATYDRGDDPGLPALSRLSLATLRRLDSRVQRRHDPEIPADRVRSSAWVDAALAVENRLGSASARRAAAVWRTKRFDRALTRLVDRERPEALLTFSDVGSGTTLPACRRLGISTVLSVVTGDPREERAVLDRERERSPEWFEIYLGDGRIDRQALDWLHERRLREIELADRVLVPSEHLAETLARHGTPRAKVAVVPYAADTRRFRPDPSKRHGTECRFLFAGGITQRKGIRYLLEAWSRVRRPGWTLELLGALPRHLGPLAARLDGVAWLGQVGHADVPARMARADVFVFPSLFEGSAVVTYEALACGLPCLVTPEAGSVVRDGQDGFLVPSADPEILAARMEELGKNPDLRATLSLSARRRAEAFDWRRYHEAIVGTLRDDLPHSSHGECPVSVGHWIHRS